MDKKITIKYLVDMCNQFKNQEISIDEFKQKCDEIFVKNSLGIREKVYSVMYVLFYCDYSDDLLERFVSLEMNKFWYITLVYCGIDAEKEKEYCTEENYDLIRPLIFDAIMSISGNDYLETMKLLDSIISYVYAMDNQDMYKSLMETDFATLIESDRKLIEDLQKNESIIKDLADITRSTNPQLSNINSMIEKQVVNEINNK